MVWRHTLLLTALVGVAGCPNLQGPGYLHPGSAQRQQNQAQRFDPFPATDVGPEMAARPLGFMRPAPETERIQNVDSFIKRYRQPPPVERYRPPRTSIFEPGVPFIPAAVAPGAAPFYVP